MTNRRERRLMSALARSKAKTLPRMLTRMDEADWPTTAQQDTRVEVWQCQDYLVQLFEEPNDVLRMSVNRTKLLTSGRFDDGISWGELQRIKRDVGLGDYWAVECFPADEHVVDVANMRHLWVLPEAPAYGWRKNQ